MKTIELEQIVRQKDPEPSFPQFVCRTRETSSRFMTLFRRCGVLSAAFCGQAIMVLDGLDATVRA